MAKKWSEQSSSEKAATGCFSIIGGIVVFIVIGAVIGGGGEDKSETAVPASSPAVIVEAKLDKAEEKETIKASLRAIIVAMDSCHNPVQRVAEAMGKGKFDATAFGQLQMAGLQCREAEAKLGVIVPPKLDAALVGKWNQVVEDQCVAGTGGQAAAIETFVKAVEGEPQMSDLLTFGKKLSTNFATVGKCMNGLTGVADANGTPL